MAIYRRQYRPFAGRLTPANRRFLVIARYAIGDLSRSRVMMTFLWVTGLPVLVQAAVIYLSHNAAARALLGLLKLNELVRIDSQFFVATLATQCFLGFILAAWAGPGLIGADLANGGLPLLLSRPFSRSEYVLGKATALFAVTAAVTWLPGLLLYLLNAALEQRGWWFANLRIAGGIFMGGMVWCGVVTLCALSLSAWIRWRLAASSMLIGLYFVSAGFGEALVAALGVSWGRLLNTGLVFRTIWSQLLGAPSTDRAVHPGGAWAVLCVLSVLSLIALDRRLRAREVVR